MSSSFQNKNDLDLEDVFQNVSALYCILKQGEPHSMRRAELKQGVCTAEPVDFIADFELRCKRTLNPIQCRLVLNYVTNDRCQSIPKSIQHLLGRLFLETDLSVDGAYRILFYRAKNNQLIDRDEPQHFMEEEA